MEVGTMCHSSRIPSAQCAVQGCRLGGDGKVRTRPWLGILHISLLTSLSSPARAAFLLTRQAPKVG